MSKAKHSASAAGAAGVGGAAAATGAVAKTSKTKIILRVILALLLVLVAFVGVNAVLNTKSMNELTDRTLAAIDAEFPLTEVDTGEFSDITVKGVMHFHCQQYEAEGLGNVFVMRVNVIFMQMLTVTVVPYEQNAATLALDYMYMLHNKMGLVEFYDLVDTNDEVYQQHMQNLQSIGAGYSDLKDRAHKESWADYLTNAATTQKNSTNDARLQEMVDEMISTYIKQCKEATPLETKQAYDEHVQKVQDFADGYVENGGMATDMFVSSIGAEKTSQFFNDCMYATGKYAKRYPERILQAEAAGSAKAGDVDADGAAN